MYSITHLYIDSHPLPPRGTPAARILEKVIDCSQIPNPLKTTVMVYINLLQKLRYQFYVLHDCGSAFIIPHTPIHYYRW